MAQCNVKDLSPSGLDYAVAMCNVAATDLMSDNWTPSTNWAQGGPIIEREEISVQPTGDAAKWRAHMWSEDSLSFWPLMYGPTPLIAAMRCYVVSKVEDIIEIPDQLL